MSAPDPDQNEKKPVFWIRATSKSKDGSGSESKVKPGTIKAHNGDLSWSRGGSKWSRGRLKNGAEEAQKWSRGGSKLPVETLRVFKPVVALSHHFDPDPEPNRNERYDPDPHQGAAYLHPCLLALSSVKKCLCRNRIPVRVGEIFITE